MTVRIFHYVTSGGRDLFQDWLDRLKDRKDADIDRAIDCRQDYLRRAK